MATHPALEVVDHVGARRYEVRADGPTQVVASLRYVRNDELMALLGTVVDGPLTDRGVSAKLVRFALADARARRLEVIPVCPFVRQWFRQHREETDLLRQVRRRPGRNASHRRRVRERQWLRAWEQDFLWSIEHPMEPSRVHPDELAPPGIWDARCRGCAGRGWRERRHKPQGTVVCRVCQGTGGIRGDVLLDDGRIVPLRVSKVYWTGRPWQRAFKARQLRLPSD